MPKYFSNYDKIDYEFEVNGVKTTMNLVDITLKTIIKESNLSDSILFYTYTWKDTDRPDIVANEYYGSPDYWWVIMMSNNYYNLYYDFPMPRYQFEYYLNQKYAIHAYYSDPQFPDGLSFARAVPSHVEDEDGRFVVAGNIDNVITVIDDNYVPVGTKVVTIYEKEERENEAKRQIKLLDKQFLQKFESEFVELMSDTKQTRKRVS